MAQWQGRALRVWQSPLVQGCLMALVLVALPTCLVWWLDPALASAQTSLMWRNALPVALLALLVLALTGRTLVTSLLVGGFMVALFRINTIKELNMNQPVLPGDLVLRSQLTDNLEFFSRYLGHSAWLWLAVVAGALVLASLWWVEQRTRLAPVMRLATALIAIVGLATLFHGDGPWRAAYADENMPGFPLWHPIDGVKHDGLMAGLVRLSQEARVTIPPADLNPVRAFVASYASELKARSERAPPAELPDIVMVQSEAFFEPGLLKGVEFGQYAPNFARLSAQGITGALGTPAYGGGTIRTEFETLTGYPVLAFPSIVYPYYGLANHRIRSMPRRLRKLGYDTRLLHPFTGSFWNRSEVMPQLGFTYSSYAPDFGNASHAGFYVSDEALFDRVSRELDAHPDKPQFVMAITMENHGPWESDVGAFAQILKDKPLPGGLSDEARRELVHYLSHLVNGDRALGELSARLLARRQWTVLLFYGDHLPALPHAFEEVGFDDSQPGPAQHTRYLLLSNRRLVPHQLDLKAYDLPGLVFDTLGLPEDGLLAIEAQVRESTHQEPPAQPVDYEPVVFNAARLAEHCQGVVTLQATCATDAGAR